MPAGSTLIYFPELDSTNRFAAYLVSKTRPRPGTVILTDFQHEGRGQNGRSWYGSKGKNLYFTLILRPSLEARHAYIINAAFALAIRRSVEACLGPDPLTCSIKWPNDVLCDGKKIAGILIQNVIQGKNVRYMLAGVGLNVNETRFPNDLPNATSLSIESGKELHLRQVLEEALYHIEVNFANLEASGPLHILDQYNAHLFGRNSHVAFTTNGVTSPRQGTIQGIDSEGKLLIDTGQRLEKFVHGQIEINWNEVQDHQYWR